MKPVEEITPYLKVTKVTPGSRDLHRRLYWEVKLPGLKGIGQNPTHGRKPKVKPQSNDRWQKPVNAGEITRWNSLLTFHSHKNNRTLKLNNDIPKGNTSTDDAPCIVLPPGHTPEPEFHTVQGVCGRRRGGWKWEEQRNEQEGEESQYLSKGRIQWQFISAPSQRTWTFTSWIFLSDIWKVLQSSIHLCSVWPLNVIFQLRVQAAGGLRCFHEK